jgi:hypothetical protein
MSSSGNQCPSKRTRVFLESVQDLRKLEQQAQIGLVHVGLMNLPTPVLLEPIPKITIATEIRNALQRCGMLASPTDAIYVARVELRNWSVEEDIGLTSEEMNVRLEYTATLTARADGKISSQEIAAGAKRSGLDTTDYAQELNREVLAQTTAKLLNFVAKVGAHE